MVLEIIKLLIYMTMIIIISKYILVKTLRNLAENLNLKPKTVGRIAGYATSIPEFITITISSFSGLINTSIYNILSSNTINFVQYFLTVLINKNAKVLNNKAIKTDLILVVLTIIIPVVFILMDIEINIKIVPIFILLFALFKVIDSNVHKMYLKKQDKAIDKEIEKEAKNERENINQTISHIAILIVAGIALYFIGDSLSVILENLCYSFGVSQIFIGIVLGMVTSIPELITFLEAQKHYKARKDSTPGIVEATNNLLESNCLNLFIIQAVGIIIFAVCG